MAFTFTINGHTYTNDSANAAPPAGYRFEGYGYLGALANLVVDIVAVAAATVLSATAAGDSAANAAEQAALSGERAALATSNGAEQVELAAGHADTAAQAVIDCAALLDQFDDRYLGVKAADPATDNDGNPLVAGAIYINSVSGYIRAYTGAAWTQGISVIAGVESLNGLQGALSIKTLNGEALVGSGNIELTSDIALTASGSITAGTFVSLKSSDVVIASGIDPASIGDVAVIEAGSDGVTLDIVIDASSGAVVVLYKVGSALKVIVGSVVGGVITWGAPVSVATVTGGAKACYIGAGKIVVAYIDSATGYAKAVVGTISGGTSASFGAAATVRSASTSQHICVFHSAADRVVFFAVEPVSGGAYGHGYVASVSGTALSVGSVSTFNTVSYTQALCAAYDAAAVRIVLGWREGQVGQSSYLSVFSVSGLTLSSEGVVATGTYQVYPRNMVYDATAQCCLYTYIDQAASGQYKIGRVLLSGGSISSLLGVVNAPGAIGSAYYVAALTGTAYVWPGISTDKLQVSIASVSAGSISFGVAGELTAAAASAPVVAALADGAIIVAMRDTSSTYAGALVYTPALTNSARWVGVAKTSVTNGQEVKCVGLGGVASGFSGLAPKTTYYLAPDGSLSASSAAGPKVGYAVSTTKLYVTGGAK